MWIILILIILILIQAQVEIEKLLIEIAQIEIFSSKIVYCVRLSLLIKHMWYMEKLVIEFNKLLI